jgi:hypothetical protein
MDSQTSFRPFDLDRRAEDEMLMLQKKTPGSASLFAGSKASCSMRVYPVKNSSGGTKPHRSYSKYNPTAGNAALFLTG